MSNTNNVNNQLPATRITSRSIATSIFLQYLPQRCQYHGKKAFTLEAGEKFHPETNPEGLFESYTQFRQFVRDQIIEATGCTAASARTMFIWVKDNTIEQCKADGKFEVGGKELTIAELSLVRDIKPKKVKEEAPAEEAQAEETPVEEENPKAWKVVSEKGRTMRYAPTKEAAEALRKGKQKVVENV